MICHHPPFIVAGYFLVEVAAGWLTSSISFVLWCWKLKWVLFHNARPKNPNGFQWFPDKMNDFQQNLEGSPWIFQRHPVVAWWWTSVEPIRRRWGGCTRSWCFKVFIHVASLLIMLINLKLQYFNMLFDIFPPSLMFVIYLLISIHTKKLLVVFLSLRADVWFLSEILYI